MNKILNLILSHHWDNKHCVSVSCMNKNIYLCSRCLGLYPAAILWLSLAQVNGIKFSYSIERAVIVYTLLPLFLDWSLTALGLVKSNNYIRFFSGLIASFGISRWWYITVNNVYPALSLKSMGIYVAGCSAVLFLILLKGKT